VWNAFRSSQGRTLSPMEKQTTTFAPSAGAGCRNPTSTRGRRITTVPSAAHARPPRCCSRGPRIGKRPRCRDGGERPGCDPRRNVSDRRSLSFPGAGYWALVLGGSIARCAYASARCSTTCASVSSSTFGTSVAIFFAIDCRVLAATCAASDRASSSSAIVGITPELILPSRPSQLVGREELVAYARRLSLRR
jgi:hypothetical protein